MYSNYTTLNDIHSHGPDNEGWNKLTAGLPAQHRGDTPIPFGMILSLCGPYFAIWALQANRNTSAKQAEMAFACDCAERVLSAFEARYPHNSRPRDCLDAARRFLAGKITKAGLGVFTDAVQEVLDGIPRDITVSYERASAGAAIHAVQSVLWAAHGSADLAAYEARHSKRCTAFIVNLVPIYMMKETPAVNTDQPDELEVQRNMFMSRFVDIDNIRHFLPSPG